jgi:hypothetical protein
VDKAVHFHLDTSVRVSGESFFFPAAKPSHTTHSPTKRTRLALSFSSSYDDSILMRRSKRVQSGVGGGDGGGDGGDGGGRQVLGESGRRQSHHRDDTNEIKKSSECSSSKRARISRDHTANDNGEFVERESPHGNSARRKRDFRSCGYPPILNSTIILSWGGRSRLTRSLVVTKASWGNEKEI